MTIKEALKNFYKLYLMALAVTLAILTIGALILAALINKPFLEVMHWALIMGAFVLLGIGFISLLPFSEYAYTRGAKLNPVIAREGMRHMRAGKDSKMMSIILGVVGFTLLLIYFIIFQ